MNNSPRRNFILPAIILSILAALVVIVLLVLRSLNPVPLVAVGDLVVYLTEIQDDVQIRKMGQENFAPASIGDRIHVGDRLRTGAEGLARLDLSNGTIAQIGQQTLLTLQRLAVQESAPFSLLSMESGELWAIIKSGWMQVDTPFGTAAASDSYLHVRIDESTGAVEFTCLAGRCEVTNALGSVDLKAGQKASIRDVSSPPMLLSDVIASSDLLTATAIALITTTPTPFIYTTTPTPSPSVLPSPTPLLTSTSGIPTLPPTECPVPEGWLPYTVKAGDTLYDIARVNDTTIDELKTGNCLASSIIRVGQVLYVPPLDPTQTVTTTNTPTITHTATVTATPTLTGTSTNTNTPTATGTNTPTPTATRPSDAALAVSVSGGENDCYEVDFDVTLENTGERADARNVIVMVNVTKGEEYVSAVSQNSLDYGDIEPGSAEPQTVTVYFADSWLNALVGTEARIEAVVVQETSRPEHNVGKRDVGITTNPGNCTP